MQRFFFNVEYGETSIDDEGTEFPDILHARTAAVIFLTEVLRDLGDVFWSKPNVAITVSDESGLTLYRLDATGTEAAAVASLTSKA